MPVLNTYGMRNPRHLKKLPPPKKGNFRERRTGEQSAQTSGRKKKNEGQRRERLQRLQTEKKPSKGKKKAGLTWKTALGSKTYALGSPWNCPNQKAFANKIKKSSTTQERQDKGRQRNVHNWKKTNDAGSTRGKADSSPGGRSKIKYCRGLEPRLGVDKSPNHQVRGKEKKMKNETDSPPTMGDKPSGR